MATHSVVVDPVEIRDESPESDTIARKPAWSDWTLVCGGWMRRRSRVPGMNSHWGKWYLNRSHNQHFRFNPASNRTHIETAKQEFQFHWNDRNPVSVTSRDCDAGRTSAAEPDSEESAAALSELDLKHRNITRYHKLKGRRHRASSSIASDKSALASFSGVSAASAASTSDHAVTTSSLATEMATIVAAWIFGTIMTGVGVGTMRATQKTADSGTRSAVAGESSALSSRKRAAAAEKSARAATKSARAAENGVAVMQKQLEVMIQDKRGPPPARNSTIGPPADNSGSRTGSVVIPREQKTGRSVSTATPPAPGAALTSAPVD
ncbi:hypothetical protein B0J15DRAFT_354921, partial [Fusarium solani]